MKVQNIPALLYPTPGDTTPLIRWVNNINVYCIAITMSDVYLLNSGEPFDLVSDNIHLFGITMVTPTNGKAQSDYINSREYDSSNPHGSGTCLVKYAYSDNEKDSCVWDKTFDMFKHKVGLPPYEIAALSTDF